MKIWRRVSIALVALIVAAPGAGLANARAPSIEPKGRTKAWDANKDGGLSFEEWAQGAWNDFAAVYDADDDGVVTAAEHHAIHCTKFWKPRGDYQVLVPPDYCEKVVAPQAFAAFAGVRSEATRETVAERLSVALSTASATASQDEPSSDVANLRSEARRKLQTADVDGSGDLSFDEWLAASWYEIAHFDADQNGGVSKQEWTRTFCAALQAAEATCDNRTRMMSVKQFNELAGATGEITKDDLAKHGQSRFNVLDADKDGLITPAEADWTP